MGITANIRNDFELLKFGELALIMNLKPSQSKTSFKKAQ
jgi:hypothetical protein